MNFIILYLILSPLAPSSSSMARTSSGRTAHSPEVADAVSVLMIVDDPVSDRVDGLSSMCLCSCPTPSIHMTYPKFVTSIRGFPTEVNREIGRTKNRSDLLQLEQQLVSHE